MLSKMNNNGYLAPSIMGNLAVKEAPTMPGMYDGFIRSYISPHSYSSCLIDVASSHLVDAKIYIIDDALSSSTPPVTNITRGMADSDSVETPEEEQQKILNDIQSALGRIDAIFDKSEARGEAFARRMAELDKKIDDSFRTLEKIFNP